MADQYASINTDAGRALIWAAVAEKITHLAIGSGAVTVTSGVLQKPPRSAGLAQELGRVRYLEKKYIVPDPVAGALVDRATGKRYAVSAVPTNQLYLLFRFLSDEAQGFWRQTALFADDIAYLQRGATLLDVGGLAGDDHANHEVVLSGGYTPAESQRITVTCSTAGGSGVAKVGWVSSGSVATALNVTVTFGTPVPIVGSGLALNFSGGDDGVLTLGAQWEIRGTRSSQTSLFAANGLYDPLTNAAGQVLTAGTCFQLIHRTPAFQKTAAAIDVPIFTEVLHA